MVRPPKKKTGLRFRDELNDDLVLTDDSGVVLCLNAIFRKFAISRRSLRTMLL